MYRLKNTYLHVLMLTMIFIIGYSCVSRVQAQVIEEGELDLSDYNFLKKGIYDLNGDWEFYPNQLITPEDFALYNYKSDSIYYIQVPGLWHKDKHKAVMSAKYGTYRLVFDMPDASLYALNINRIQSAYKLWVNDRFLLEQGRAVNNKDSARAFWSARNLVFKSKRKQNELVIQVSNFHHKKSGIEKKITVGKPEQIAAYSWKILGTDVFLIGVLLIMGFYHLGLYLTHRREISSLFFALTMFAAAVFSGTVGEILFTKIFEDFNWELLVKINYVSNYLRLGFFVLFISFVFPEVAHRRVLIGFSVFALLNIIFVLLTPARIYTHTLIVFLVFAIFGIGLILWILTAAVRKKLPGSVYSLIGMIILAATAVNDILTELAIINSVSLATGGMFIFTIFQAHILALRSAYYNNSLEQLQKRLLTLAQIKDDLLKSNTNDLDALLNVVGDALKVTHAVLFVNDNNKWRTEVEYALGVCNDINAETFGAHDNVSYPKELIKSVIENGEDISIEARRNTDENLSDYFVKHSIQTIFCIVIGEAGKPESILFLEDKDRNRQSTIHKHKVLQTIKPQIQVFIENYKFYRKLRILNQKLERQVDKRTREIRRQNEEIEAVRDEIEKQNKYLHKAYEELEYQNIEIAQSIQYAQKIQESILPKLSYVTEVFPESFIFFKPKEKLSGDFYWVQKCEEIGNQKDYFACVDCTGHGVPGALMSIVGNNLLNQALKEEKITQPAKILDKMQIDINARLKQKSGASDSKDGMDLALISYDKTKMMLEYAGARRPLVHFRNGILTEYAGDKMSVGGMSENTDKQFTNHKIKIEDGDVIYLFSDGYTVQFGGEHGRKFLQKRFRDLLTEIHLKEMKEQQRILALRFNSWKSCYEQTDDVTVVGIRF